MRGKRSLLSLILVFVMVMSLALTGCGKDDPAKDPDVSETDGKSVMRTTRMLRKIVMIW